MRILSQINIYPVKSLDGFSTRSAIVEKRGLQYDRRWMITDSQGVFMTQRDTPRMAFLRATINDNYLKITEKQNEENYIKILIDTESESHKAEVWGEQMQVAHVSTEANIWLSHFLGESCHLVKMPEATERRVDERFNTGEDIVSFADGYPFLLLGDASMKDLNARLKTPVSSRRFRANLLFTGGIAFEEDNYRDFKVGDVDFISVKPCARCVLVTRHPDSGRKDKEPLHTLATYRQRGNKIIFGQNVLWNQKQWNQSCQPEIKVGDVLVTNDE